MGSLEEIDALVVTAQQGDRRALERLLCLVRLPILRYARARMSSTAEPTPEDVVQEVCLALATGIDSYTYTGKPFMAYVYGVASHKIVDARRAASRNKSTPAEEIPDGVDTRPNPEESALHSAGCNEMRQLLDGLSDRARDIVILRVVEGYSAEETARLLGMTAGAVRVAQHRALTNLKKRLQG
ncbi:RNA polymerase sigma factor ShbA [Corynebacterium uterequi]|uniref:RNA polymerase sigma factor, sigma-70 family n=1 Tax=Corynebacterium uterequi TaxID=1072256 RepID=A0A0G3HH12_9CORY|nr:RNA polymerase sigma factor ShbA [Corynebacterium uterequi]AKK10442.1 RNA polymerase sigma factor, sigma-70 family [Corynebacterium uterequi]